MILLARNPATQLLLCMVLGVSCAVFTFLTLDYMGADTRQYTTAVFGHYRQRAEEYNSSAPQSVSPTSVLPDNIPSLPPPPRVLVWVMTQPDNHKKKAVHVRDTWGKRVDKLLFMSSADDADLPSVNLHVQEGRNFLWGKTKAAFKYVYDHHLDEYDWFMKADDDTFVVVENLRYMLSLYDPKDPIYFGSRFKPFNPQGYMSGGGGYVLSRTAVSKFVEDGLPDSKKCKKTDTGAEDAEMGKCMTNVGVMAGDSRDDSGRGRFFPFIPAHHLISGFIGEKSWYWDYIYYPMKVGPECCSDTAITFHYITPDKMRELNYLLYHLRPWGVHPEYPYPPHLPPDLKSVPNNTIEKYVKN